MARVVKFVEVDEPTSVEVSEDCRRLQFTSIYGSTVYELVGAHTSPLTGTTYNLVEKTFSGSPQRRRVLMLPGDWESLVAFAVAFVSSTTTRH